MRVLLPCLIVLLLATAAAAEWKGEERDVDGVTHVLNPDEGILPPLQVELTELWRLGGYSDAPEEFFGVISDIESDAQNDFYVLDAQLNEIRVFDQAGVYLTTMGREGEGPGEFRRPQDLNLLPDGTIGVVQPFPSKMVLLDTDGNPAGDYNFTPRGEGFAGLSAAATVGGNIALNYSMGNFDRESQTFSRTSRLCVFDVAGTELQEMTAQTAVSGPNTRVYAETDWNGFEEAWSASRAGVVAARTSFTEYEVSVWNDDGSPRHVIRREFAPVKRTADQIEAIENRWAASIARWVQDPSFDLEENWNPVVDVFAREDGTIWVQNSRETYGAADGQLTGFDVFDTEGRFERTIRMNGDFDPGSDGLFLSGNYLLVVTDLQAARQAAMAGSGVEMDIDEDAEPMEIVCYRMELSPLARADR